MARWNAEHMPDQAGRVVLVTGANSGLGLRSAQALAAKGARVLMGCRNQEKAKAARDEVLAAATGPEPEVVALDLADLASVRTCAEQVDSTVGAGGLHVLMNNAGLMAVPRARTADGFEMQFGTNHLGHFALTGHLLPALSRSGDPRVVTVSSTAHRTGRMRWNDINWERGRYAKWLAYGQSKLANLLFSGELSRRAAAAGSPLLAAAAHPGYASTHLQAVGPEMSGNRLAGVAMRVANVVIGQSDTMGALPQLYAATMPDVKPDDYWGPDRLFESRGHPNRVRRTRAARDTEAAARLWDVSEQLTGVTYSWD